MDGRQMKDNEQVSQIKDSIVRAYRRGECNHLGGWIPEHKRGMSGKGSHFAPKRNQRYLDNFDKIQWGNQ
jgi:hypothetical protein